jgi:predicted Zn-dependent peptidase
MLAVQETRLANDVRVLTAQMTHVRSAALGVWVGVGGRYESARQSGISHFIEHLLFKGSRKRSARAISQAIEGRGGYLNAFTQEESTCYYARASAAHMGQVIDTLGDMYLHPRFAAADIEKERGVILEEIMMYRDQPQHLVHDYLGELMWVKHPVGRPLIGPPDNIRRFSRDDIVDFKAAKYRPANTLFAFAGNVDHDTCVREVDRLTADFKAGRAPRWKGVETSTPQQQIYVHQKEIEQTHLAMGFRVFGRHDKRRLVLKVLSVMLGENMSSRLFQVVREKHGLAYSVHSGTHLFDETGGFIISAGLDRQKTGKAVQLIAAEVARMGEKPVSATELRRAKDYAIGHLEIGLESTINQMMWIGENTLSYGRVLQPQEVVEAIQAVTADDVQQLATGLLRACQCSVAVVTPNDAAATEKQIATALQVLQ